MRAVLLALVIAASAIVGAPAQGTPPEPTAPVIAPAAETIVLREVVPVRVEKTGRPGQLRVTNPNDHWVRFLWGTFRRAQPDGRKRIDAYRSVLITVRRHRIDWIALLDGDQVAGQGSVAGIRLSPRQLPGIGAAGS